MSRKVKAPGTDPKPGKGENRGPSRGKGEGRGASHRIAVVAGDGIGMEVVPEGQRVLEAAGRKFGFSLEWDEKPWSCEYYKKHGEMMPKDGLASIRHHDAIFLGAVGFPGVPDHVSLWGLLLPLRQGLDLWANIRPARLLDGVPSPLAGAPAVDMLFVRENTEGEYSGVGGRAHRGHGHEVGIETAVFTREGVRRVVEHAFELAEGRSKRLTSATKSNASRYGYVLWDEIVEEVAVAHPEIQVERALVDALAARMVSSPLSLDVVVASNLFGDVLTDIAAVLQGGMGMAASASVAPGAGTTAIFEPVHGSAPDIAGKGLANPIGAIWSAALMLEHLGEAEAAARLMRAIEATCKDGPRTRDIGGTASTSEVGDAVAASV
jgi:tartrate dehydrogenase/decarboxylase/D-malate dehydrogenase